MVLQCHFLTYLTGTCIILKRDSVREVSDIDSLEDKINELRKKLTEIVQNKGCFTNEEVVQISQQLDSYIVEMQSRQGKRKSK